MFAFGPVPSRRFGQSLGVNNIPPKICTYSCVYCQLGPTKRMRVRRRPFHSVRDVRRAVDRRVVECRARGEAIDYLTFVPDGEPTLDALLGPQIQAIKAHGIPVAVITNSSLLWRPEVRADLMGADVVSVKIDTTDAKTWRRANRPGRQLRLPRILDGITRFRAEFPGEVWTETMLMAGINDDAAALEGVARFLQEIAPKRAYIAVPIRPPAVSNVRPPPESATVEAHEMLSERVPRVELLTGQEKGSFGHGDDPTEDLLAILAVHPMREAVAQSYLEEVGADPTVLDALLAGDLIAAVEYGGTRFVARRT